MPPVIPIPDPPHDARDLIEDGVEITSTSEDVTITDEFGVEVSDLELVAD